MELYRKWLPVLGSDLGPKIENKKDAEDMAILLENTTRLNKQYLPEHEHIAAECNKFQEYALPLIRKYYFSNLSSKIFSVFQTSTPAGIYKFLRYSDVTDDFKEVEGTVIVGTRTIEMPLLTDVVNISDSSKDGRDIVGLVMEKSIYNYNTTIDNELVAAMAYCATNKSLGGDDVLEVNLNDVDIVKNLFDRSQDIENNTHVKEAKVFVICSANISAILSKRKEFSENKDVSQVSRYVETGTLTLGDRRMLVIVDSMPDNPELYYSIVGINGAHGQSGIGFMPYLPFIFSKLTKSSEMHENIKVAIKTRYAIISSTIGSGTFYRYTRYDNTIRTSSIEENREISAPNLTLEEGLMMLSSKTLLEMRDTIAAPKAVHGTDKIWLESINKELQSRDKTDATFNDM